MASELVITSVRKGLDGGSGFQPVLRTKGMRPSLGERIRIRVGYAHPFPHGDSKNPTVYVHRVEKIGGESLHFLTRIADAGSDHTGRSNFLAHALVLDESETRRKPAGPAETIRRFPFRSTWDEPARECEAPLVVGGERTATPSAAWRAAGLDPGIAGDLAELAMAGRSARIIVRPNDDVLSLFADALALVAPAQRWQVTFTTCEIEPFEGVWRAIRADLPQARGLMGTPGLIDLTSAAIRGSDGPYARFARGDLSVCLPWQALAPAASAGLSAPERQIPVKTEAIVTSRPEEPTDSIGFTRVSGRGGFDLSEATRLPPTVPPQSSIAPLPPAKRNLEELARSRATSQPENTATEPTRFNTALGILAIACGVGVIAAAVWLLASPSSNQTPETQNTTQAESKQKPSPTEGISSDIARQEEEKRRAKERLAELKRQENERKQEEAQKLEEEERRKREELAAVAKDAEEKAQKELAKAKELADKRSLAFTALKEISETIGSDLPSDQSLIDGVGDTRPIDLGAFDFALLDNVSFDIAYPKDTFQNKTLMATVTKDKTPGSLSWTIESIEEGLDGGKSRATPLARLSVSNKRLFIEPDKQILNHWRYCLLRRSVILLKATDPNASDSLPKIQRAIRLIQPKKMNSAEEFEPLSTSRPTKEIDLRPYSPAAITIKESSAAPVLPQSDCRIVCELKWDGWAAPHVKTLTIEAGSETKPEPLGENAELQTQTTFEQGKIRISTIFARNVTAEWLKEFSANDAKKSKDRIDEISKEALSALRNFPVGNSPNNLLADFKVFMEHFKVDAGPFIKAATEKLATYEAELNKIAPRPLPGTRDPAKDARNERAQSFKPDWLQFCDQQKNVVSQLQKAAIKNAPLLRDAAVPLRQPVVLRIKQIVSDAYLGDQPYPVPLFIGTSVDENTPTPLPEKQQPAGIQ